MQKTKSQKAEFNLESKGIKGIETVKNSSVFEKNGFVYAVHYGKVIFQFDISNKTKTLIDFDCSPTSNRLIYRCLDYYAIDKNDCINLHEGSKMNYSESRSY